MEQQASGWKKSRAELGVGIILFSVIILGASELHTSIQPLAEISQDDLSAQITGDLQKAIRLNNQSRSFQEWDHSGYTARDIFKFVKDMKSKEAWDILCTKLLKLEPEDLALFETELAKPSGANTLPPACQPSAIQALLQPVWTKPLTLNHPVNNQNRLTILFYGWPHQERTDQILRILAKTNLRAVFSFSKEQARQYPELIRKIVKQKHTIGIISQLPRPPQTTLQQVERDIHNDKSVLENIIGEKIHLVHLLETNGTTHESFGKMLEKKNLSAISPTIDSRDWQIRNPTKLLDHIVSKLNTASSNQNEIILALGNDGAQTGIILQKLLDNNSNNIQNSEKTMAFWQSDLQQRPYRR